jgi:peptide deformylase
MANLPILEYPDPRLRIRAEPVTEFDEALSTLVADMFETMYSAPGIGLAATQINVHKRILVADISEERNQPYCLVNPEVVSAEGQVSYEEGCLSVPGVFEPVDRAEKIKVTALDLDGKPTALEVEGLLAICIQHEIDHLNGKLFVDYLSALKRERLKKKLAKQTKKESPSRESGPAKARAPVI